ncbi:ADP-heptose--LPS heptosyltransferase RfaF [Candidatus Gillettellia adelgis]
MKILVVGPSWVGDMMMSQSLYRTLKVKYPSAKIDVMAVAWCRPLLMWMPEVHQSLLMPLDHGTLGLSARVRLGHSLRAKQYDRAYILSNSFKSALVPFFAAVPQRIGWRGEMRYGVLNDMRVLDKTAFPLMVQRYIALAYNKRSVMCANDLPQPLLFPRLQISEAEILKISSAFNFNNHRPMISFCPGAEFGQIKCWPHYHYTTLAQKLIEQGYRITLFGSKKDFTVGEKIYAGLESASCNFCLNLVGKTRLEEAMILMASSQAIISNDSGLMHIAAALNKPLIALYGPTSPEFTPPLSKETQIIRLISGYHKVRNSDTKTKYHVSLINLQPQQVLEALMLLLATTKE